MYWGLPVFSHVFLRQKADPHSVLSVFWAVCFCPELGQIWWAGIQMPPEAERQMGKVGSMPYGCLRFCLSYQLPFAFVAVTLEGAAPSFSVVKAKTK